VTQSKPSELTLQKGGKLSLSFKTYASAGYLWLCHVPHNQKDGIKITQQASTAHSANSQALIGGETKFTFNIEALNEGDYTLKFEERRPWEDKPLKTNIIKIKVR
jgi:predicted secreted protein